MRIVLSLLVAALAATLLYIVFHAPDGPAWFHLLGLGASVVVLLLIWLFPAGRDPQRPPP